MIINFLAVVFVWVAPVSGLQLHLPIGVACRTNAHNIYLTKIGAFGLIRKARPSVPAHYHTGIDLKRPTSNYTNEPVYASAKGKVISMRNEGPFSQIIIEHLIKTRDTVWTVYEHISVGNCHVGNAVAENTVIARFFNKAELDRYGWQFDHVHFEILKVRPLKIKPSKSQPECFYKTYAITCFTLDKLNSRMINPLGYFAKNTP